MFIGKLWIDDLKKVVGELGFDYKLQNGHTLQDYCPRCKRIMRGLAYANLPDQWSQFMRVLALDQTIITTPRRGREGKKMSKVEHLERIIEKYGPHLDDAPIDGWQADRTSTRSSRHIGRHKEG